MKKYIHVNQHTINANKKCGTRLPVLTILSDSKPINCSEIVILGQDRKEACRLVYSPDKPLKNNATVWIETDNKIEFK